MIDYEKKVRREILKNSRMKLVPPHRKNQPLVLYCKKCKTGLVKHHHFLCDKCHVKKQKKKLDNQKGGKKR